MISANPDERSQSPGVLGFLGVVHIAVGYTNVIISVVLFWLRSGRGGQLIDGGWTFWGGMSFLASGLILPISGERIRSERRMVAMTAASVASALVSVLILVSGFLDAAGGWSRSLPGEDYENYYDYFYDIHLFNVKVVHAMVTILLAVVEVAVSITSSVVSFDLLRLRRREKEVMKQELAYNPEKGHLKEVYKGYPSPGSLPAVSHHGLHSSDEKKANNTDDGGIRTLVMFLGIFQITIGSLFVASNVALILFTEDVLFPCSTGYGIWGGLLIITSGFLEIRSRNSIRTNYLVKASVVTSIIIACSISIVLYYSIAETFSGFVGWQYSRLLQEAPSSDGLRLAIGTVMASFAVIEGILCIVNCSVFYALPESMKQTLQNPTITKS